MQEIDVSDSPRSPDEIDRAAVGRVVAQVNLEDIRMVWARAGLNVAPDDVAVDWGQRTFLGFDVHAHEWSDDHSSFTVRALFAAAHKVDWTDALVEADDLPELEDDELPDVDIAVLFELTYSIDDTTGISDRDIEHFAAFNARFNAWPYWRELAQTVTNRMRIPTLLVPVLRLPATRAPAADSAEIGEQSHETSTPASEGDTD
jgi:hypothetical protein